MLLGGNYTLAFLGHRLNVGKLKIDDDDTDGGISISENDNNASCNNRSRLAVFFHILYNMIIPSNSPCRTCGC